MPFKYISIYPWVQRPRGWFTVVGGKLLTIQCSSTSKMPYNLQNKIMCLTFLTVQVYLENNFTKLLSYIKFTSIFNHWDLILFFLFLRFNSWGSKTVHWSLRISEVKRRVCLFKKKNKSHSWKWSQSKYHYSAKY